MFPPSLEPEPATVFRRANYILGILLIDRCFSFAPKAFRLLPVMMGVVLLRVDLNITREGRAAGISLGVRV
jgi:hypothetical protein